MKRRTFLIGSTIGLSALGIGALSAQGPTPSRTRVNFKTLSQQDVALFAGAVSLMQSRPSSDPGSWDFLAATHQSLSYRSNKDAISGGERDVLDYIDFDKIGSVPTSSKETWNTCIHHGGRNGQRFRVGHFLSWHRLYLEMFEVFFMDAVATVAKSRGVTPSFSGLPYWDYFTDPLLPLAFRQPMLAGVRNPLYVALREPDLLKGTKGVSVDPLALSAGDLVSQRFRLDPRTVVFGLDGYLEALTHDSVHGQIGGLMGQVPTAAWDPIFWLHHCNIDRMWAAWASEKGNAAPDVDTNWKNESFVFRLPSARVVWHAERTLQNTDYQYDSLKIGREAVATSPAFRKPPVVATARSKSGPQPLALSTPRSGEITSVGGTIALPITSSAAKASLQSITKSESKGLDDAGSASLYVVLTGLAVTAEGRRRSLLFDVRIALSGTPGSNDTSPITIGTINRFTLPSGKSTSTLRFDVTEATRALTSKGKAAISNIEVIVDPRRLSNPDGTPSDPTPSGALIRFDSIHVEAVVDK
jgi:tyrosinase